MADVHDVARYILQRNGRMSTWKLQKLVYYSQAWNLVWEEEPLFAEPIQAWANGPVVRALYNVHKRSFEVSSWGRGSVEALTDSEKGTIDAVLDFYGDQSGHWLSELTHSERPWIKAREGLAPGERGTRRITHASMANYYSRLTAA